MVGDDVGDGVGLAEGNGDGAADGLEVGLAEEDTDGDAEGSFVGTEVGSGVGDGVGGGSVLMMTVVSSSQEGPFSGLPSTFAVMEIWSSKQKSNSCLSVTEATPPAERGLGDTREVNSFTG